MPDMNHFKTTRTTMTAQEVFDTAVIGVLAQGRPSVDGRGVCLYRGHGGAKCAAGHVLKDAHYDKEKWDSTNDSSLGAIVERGDAPDYMVKHAALLQELQLAHDDKARFARNPDGRAMWMQDFRERAREIAKRRKLRMPQALYKRCTSAVQAQ